ncbi:hypothetical protein AB1N83_011946, partial [Pleurotus pulmonarius]
RNSVVRNLDTLPQIGIRYPITSQAGVCGR